jgi:UPF0755 protein
MVSHRARSGRGGRRSRQPRATTTTVRNLPGFFFAAAWTALLLAGFIWAFGPTSNVPHRIRVPEGATLRQIGHQLDQDGAINSSLAFEFIGRLMRADRQLRAGPFLIPPRSFPHQIVALLVHGRMEANEVTIPEGLTLWEVASILSSEAEIDSCEVVAAATNSKVAASLGVRAPTLEGYLFPDTYDIPVGTAVPEILAILVGRSRTVLGEVMAGRKPPKSLGADSAKVIILASIVEAEAQVPGERPRIAAVYLNRLRRGMRLEADPTVAYALRARRRLYFKDLEVDSPWNTYRVMGLPPTPICNPGRSSLEAVMIAAHAPPTADLYFVARGDGTHIFSRTYEQHEQACLRVRAAAAAGTPTSAGRGRGATSKADSLPLAWPAS